MEPGHLLHSALTRSAGGNARHLISRRICSRSKSSIHLTATTEVRRCGRITDGVRSGCRAQRRNSRRAAYSKSWGQGFPTFFAARTPLSGQSILSTPKKILRYMLFCKRYISCSVTQGSSYPLMFNLVPLGGTSTPGWEPLVEGNANL